MANYPVLFTEDKNYIIAELPDFGIITKANSIEEAERLIKIAATNRIRGAGKKIIPMPTLLENISREQSFFYDEDKTYKGLVDISFDTS